MIDINFQIRNIDVLGKTLDTLATRTTAQDDIHEFLSTESHLRATTQLGTLVADRVLASSTLPLDAELRRGKATVPLSAIDIPFHSNMLRPGIDAFRCILEAGIKVDDFRPELLVGKWITNLVGKEFSLGREYFERVADMTGSVVLKDIIRRIC
jgi:fatty acid synthase subunit beta